jgi:serine/threonine-protein kinase
MGEVFAGRYEFVDLLDDGGMGTVWRVWDRRERAYRAAKVLKQSDSASLLRFVRETSWRIEHPHVVTPLGWSAEDDRVLFTMPLIAGGTVSTLVNDFGPLPGIWVGQLVDQLLSALEAVHARDLVHRDIKPSNLLLEPTGRDRPILRLTDFGIAAPVDDPRMTRVGESIGTPGYQAPEAARGADPDPRQDLYSVGLVAWELLTGERPPVDAPTSRLDIEAIRSSSLSALIERLTQLDPQQRFGTATEARRALHATQPTDADREGADDIEVFDQLPDFPDGWSADGPVQASSLQPSPLQPSSVHSVAPPLASAPTPPPGRLSGATPMTPQPAERSPQLTSQSPATRPRQLAAAQQPETDPVRSEAGDDRPVRSNKLLIASFVIIAAGLLLIVVAVQLIN